MSLFSSFAPLAVVAAAQAAEIASVDLLRADVAAARVFVSVTFPDESVGLMLVDTGSDTTVLSRDIANALSLALVERGAVLQGLSYSVEVATATLPTLRLGEATVHDVEVAVGPLDQRLRWSELPIAGILGNNVWSQFTVELDTRAARLVLRPPGSMPFGVGRAPLRYADGHAFTPVTLRSGHASGELELAIDTGASDVILFGAAPPPWPVAWTVGVEPVVGVTSPRDAPGATWLRTTRRAEIDGVTLGGLNRRISTIARWIQPDGSQDPASTMSGLVGQDALEGARVVIDYRGGRFGLARSHRRARTVDAWGTLLAAEREAFPDVPERWLYRAKLAEGMGDFEGARRLLFELLGTSDPEILPQHAAARVAAANLARRRGDLAEAWNLLSPLSPSDLVEYDEVIAVVEGLLLIGRAAEADDVALAAIRARPGTSSCWVARAASLREQGDLDEAHASLQQAVRLAGDPDAWLLERVRIALARGDEDGALAMLRDGMTANPLDGALAMIYAVSAPPTDRELVVRDLERAVAATHPSLRPNDFLAAAFYAIDDKPRAADHRLAGIALDCCQDDCDTADTCLAWYDAAAGVELDDALRRVTRAMSSSDGDQALETLAMVRLARGEVQAALIAARGAAWTRPDDPFLQWQLDRIAAAAGRPRQ